MSILNKLIYATFIMGVVCVSPAFGQFSYVSKAPNSVNDVPETKAETKAITSNKTGSNFTTLFPNASAIKWSTNGNGYVSFINNGRKASASFNAKGKLSYVITECKMEHLPLTFRQHIANNYSNYRLYYGTEIQSKGLHLHEAILESATTFITLRYTDEGVEEIKTVNK